MANAITGNFAEVGAAIAATAARLAASEEVIERTGAEIIATRAAARAPRFTGYMAARTDDAGGVVIVDTPYAGYVEYGTRHNAAQPFLRPAAAESEPALANAAEGIVTIATR